MLLIIKNFNIINVSTSANISEKPNPKSLKEIAPQVLKGVDYVVNLQSRKKLMQNHHQLLS